MRDDIDIYELFFFHVPNGLSAATAYSLHARPA